MTWVVLFLLGSSLVILAAGRTPVNEAPCLRAGGACTLKNMCAPEMQATKKGLCPKQEESGVVCCHEAMSADCHSQGGECLTTSQCHRAPRKITAKCLDDKICCVLLV